MAKRRYASDIQLLWPTYPLFSLALAVAIHVYVILTPPDAHPARHAVTVV